MKRKITELEQILLNDGWYLISKSYKGKHSEKTDFYDYKKCLPYDKDLGLDSVVRLNADRTKVINYCIPNVNVAEMTKEQHEELHCRFNFLQDYVRKLLAHEEPKKCEENHTLKKSELTPKQLFIIEKNFGTLEIDKLAHLDNLLSKLIQVVKNPDDLLKIISVFTKEGII